MPGKMIRRDVEHHGHIRREQARRGQLVAGGLRHVHVGVPGGHRIDASLADVAHGGRVHARLPQQMAGERGRSGLAVGASDGDPLRGSVALAPGEFHLADHLGGGRSGAPIERGVLGNAGARDAQIVGAFDGLVVEEHHGPALAGASAQASAASPGAPAATASVSTRLPSASKQYSAAAVPDFPSPKISTRPRFFGACFLPAIISTFSMPSLAIASTPPASSRSTAQSRRRPACPKRSRSARPPSSPTSPSSRNDGAEAP